MSSLRPFFTGIVDYAGLFPPAKLDMSSAVHAYAEYLRGRDADLLGRFVVPAVRLEEFSAVASALLPHEGAPWKLSVIGSDDLDQTKVLIEHFNGAHEKRSIGGHAVCDTIEIPVNSHDDVRNAVATFGDDTSLFLEVSAFSDPAYLISAIADTSASVKIRTGGITESAFPPADQVMRFIESCVDNGVPFKATAGLHHAIRGSYPLTYDDGAHRATMFGFLNIFFAAAFCAAGSSESAVLAVIEETDPAAFRCNDAGVWWEDHVVTHEQLSVVRQAVAVSFGSCSFVEPVEEARKLHFI